MSKALVIKGASFAANKVETITLSQPIPCTGLSVSPTTVSFTALNETQQLTVIKTPADITDELTWVSSDPMIATVADGLVTCVGLGTSTITAICGEQTATCLVTVQSITFDANAEYTYMNGIRYSGSYEAPNKDYAGVGTRTNTRLYYSEVAPASGYHAFVTSGYESLYPIPIPYGTNTIFIDSKNTFTNGIGYALFDDTQHQTYVDNADSAAKCVGAVFYSDKIASHTIDLTNYPDANSFIFNPYAPTDTDASTITGNVSVTFSVSQLEA